MDQIFDKVLSRRWHFVAQLIVFAALASVGRLSLTIIVIMASMILLVMRLNDLKWARWIAYPVPICIAFAALVRGTNSISIETLAPIGNATVITHYLMVLTVGIWPRRRPPKINSDLDPQKIRFAILDEVLDAGLSRRWYIFANFMLFFVGSAVISSIKKSTGVELGVFYILAFTLLLMMRLNDLEWSRQIAYTLPAGMLFFPMLATLDVLPINIATGIYLFIFCMLIIVAGVWPRKRVVAFLEIVTNVPALHTAKAVRN